MGGPGSPTGSQAQQQGAQSGRPGEQHQQEGEEEARGQRRGQLEALLKQMEELLLEQVRPCVCVVCVWGGCSRACLGVTWIHPDQLQLHHCRGLAATDQRAPPSLRVSLS